MGQKKENLITYIGIIRLLHTNIYQYSTSFFSNNHTQ